MKSLIAAGFVLTILLLSILLGKKNKLFADTFLILYLIFAGLRQVYLYIEATGLLQESYWMLLGKGIYLLNAPFFFIYIYVLTQQRNPSPRLYVVLFLPFTAYLLHFLYYYFLIFDQATLSINNGLLYINEEVSLSWAIFVLLFLLIDPLYLIWFYILLRRYRKKLLETVSYKEDIQLGWLNILFYIWLITAIVLAPISMVTLSGGWLSTDLLQILIEAATVVFLFIIGFYGFKQTTVFTDFELREAITEKKSNSSYERSGLSQEQAKEYHSRLLTIMDEKKPWLNGELNAGELSQLLGISVNHLSQVLNREQRQNFFDFINGYRVKEVIRKMKDPRNRHLTLLAMALDSGFNSKTSFNTVFKKVTRQTPSQYYKSLANEKPFP